MSFRIIFSYVGGLLGLVSLSIVSRKMAQAARQLRRPPSIHIAGPAAAGKTTLFQYLHESLPPAKPAKTFVPRRIGRIALGLSGRRIPWFHSKITDDGLGRQTNHWAERLGKYNPEGMIIVVDTHDPDADRAYFQDLYKSYRDFSTQAKRVKLRVLLILLNKFDLWGSTSDSREAMMNRYRSEILQEIVNRFRSSFRVTVQFGYASLTQPEHMPYNNLVLEAFLTALEQRRDASSGHTS